MIGGGIRSLLAAVAALAAGCSGATQSSGEERLGSGDIAGVWVGTLELGELEPVDLETEMTVATSGNRWTARIGDEAVLLVRYPGGIRGRADSGRELRLRLAFDARPDAQRIRGHYIQPPTSPLMSYATATPVELVRGTGQSDRRYTGRVVPLADRAPIALAISRGQDGALNAFIRETSRNIGRRFRAMTVSEESGRYTFKSDDRDIGLTAALSKDTGTLSLAIGPLDRTVEMTRARRDSAPQFYPRPTESFELSPPAAKRDGWRIGTVTADQFDVAAVRSVLASIATAEPTSWDSPAVHSVLIARDGVLVVEEYFYNHTADQPHDTRSAGKSFAAALVGIAHTRGLLSPSDPMIKYLGPTDDASKRNIKLSHLLSMSSGLECDDNDENSRGNEDRMQSQDSQPDWHQYAWSLPMVRKPGEKGVYCSAGINLLGAPLARATGAWIPDFFATALAEPLRFSRYHFNLMPTREGYLGGGVRLRSRDFAKLGQLYLDGGQFGNARVVAASWIETSVKSHASVNEPNDYGYGWWRISYDIGSGPSARKVDGYYASGNGGQLIIVVPSLRLVVAINGGNYGNYGTWRNFRDVIARDIARAAR